MILFDSSVVPNSNAKVAYILNGESKPVRNYLFSLKRVLAVEEDEQLLELAPVLIKGKVSNVTSDNSHYIKSSLGDGAYLGNTPCFT